MIATTQMRALLGAMLLLLVAAPAASAAANDTTLASRANGAAGAKADGPAFESSMSTDGRYVVFATVATNLGGDTDPSTVDVYKRDRLLGNTVLVSQSTGGTYMNAADQGRYPSVSGDGRYVVFASNSTALDAADADTTFDIFLRDTQSNTTTLVSRATGAAGAKGDGASTNAVISENGRYVAFTSASTNLGADANAEPDVFVRDLQTDTTTLVSRATGAAGATSTPGTSSAVSAVSNDGRYVTFHTNESYNAADTNFADDVYVRDTTSDTTTLVSRADGAAGAVGNADSHFGSTSSDGRYVTFYSVATNLSADDADATEDVFVRDLAANVTKLVSRATGVAGVKGNNTSMNPVISANGKYIAYESIATNLVAGDTNASSDVFVRNLDTGETLLASRATGAAGVIGNGDSTRPVISTNGLIVAFASTADNLATGDADTNTDTIVRELAPPPSPAAPGCQQTNSCFTNTNPVVGGTPRICPDGNSTGVTCILRPFGVILIHGTEHADTLVGRPGSDVIYGYGGNDTIIGDRGSDSLFGGVGHDELYGGQGDDFLLGGDGADTIDGGVGNDRIGGGKGDDTLRGGPGNDEITGGDGNDKIYGDDGRDYLIGGRGNDQVWGGSGNDTLLGDKGDDRLFGEQGDDKLFGGYGNDMMWAGAGNDYLYGQWGNDQQFGEAGTDRLWGGKGKDKLIGGVDLDWIHMDGQDYTDGRNFDHIV